jgi:drug/metabolite transporter (DMT)-like permease
MQGRSIARLAARQFFAHPLRVAQDGVEAGMDAQIGNPMKGIALVLLAVMFFALGDVVTKHLTMLYAVPLVMALRYLVNLTLLVIALAPRHGWSLLRPQRTGLVIARALCLAAGSLTGGLSLRYMPVAETIAIFYLAPFIVMLLAVKFLGEKVTLAGWIGALVAFAGVVLIVRPGGGLNPLGVTFALINAVFAAFYHLLSRVLARTETTAALQIYTAGIGLMVFAVLVLIGGTGPMPGSSDLWLTLALGGLATLGHFLLTASYREAPASLLAPVNYMHLVWAGILGWLVFRHVSDGLSLLGMVMVAGAGVAVALRAHVSRRAANRLLPQPEPH